MELYNRIDLFSRNCPQKGAGIVRIVSQYGLIGLLRLILQRADQVSTNIDAKDFWGRTPLSWAAGWGHVAVVKLLLETGKAEVDSKDETNGTPLWWAVGYGHVAVVNLLLETGKAEVDSKDKRGRTPLSLAAKRARVRH